MILKNNKGLEREVKLLFELDKNNKKYIIYKDIISNNIYGGLLNGNELKSLSEEEYDMLNKVIERIEG